MDDKLLKLVKKLKRLGASEISVDGMVIKFFDRPNEAFKPSKYDLTGEEPDRMPTDDEMLFYSTDEFDRLKEERKEALKHEAN